MSFRATIHRSVIRVGRSLGGVVLLVLAARANAALAQGPDLQFGGRILFASERDGNSEIYAMNPDGADQTRLTNNSTFEARPMWSPDGTRIAFETNMGGDMEAYVMNADGSGQMALTTDPANDDMVSWSPDGTRLVFISERDGNDEVYVMNADGTNQTRLTYNAIFDDSPKWSPDGSRIVFRSFRDGETPEIYVMNADGSNQIRLTDNPAHEGNPFWSPDGARIGFSSNRDGNLDVYVMDADGSDPVRLTNNPWNEVGNSFSADGTKIAYQADLYGSNEIYVMNADGTDQTRLTNNSAIEHLPSWGEGFRQIGTAGIGSPVVRTLVVKNPGNAVLTLTSIASSQGDFAVNPNAFSVASADSQSVVVTFTPTAVGTQYSLLTLTSNDADFPVTSLVVNGTGTAVPPPVTPVGLSATPGPRQIGLQWNPNTEPSLSHYVLYRSLSAGFTPVTADSIARVDRPNTTYADTGLAAGTYHYRLAAVDLVGGRSGPSTEASATLAPTYAQSLSALSFGSVLVGGSSTQSFEITNSGTAALVTSISIAGGDTTQFQVNPATFQLFPGGMPQVVSVTFSPTVGGPASAELVISHNAPGSPARVTLNGTASGPGGPAILIAPNPVSLGDAGVGTSAQQSITVTNTGTKQLQVTSITESAGDTAQFSLVPTSFVLAPGKSQSVQVSFAPSSVGGKSMLCSFNHNALGGISAVTVTGNGLEAAPQILLSTTTMNLPTTKVGQTSAAPFSIANTGNDTLRLSVGLASGDPASFSISPTNAKLGPGDTQIVEVFFHPIAPGSHAATLAITHNAAGSPTLVALSGRGTGKALKPSVPSSAEVTGLLSNHPNPFNPETTIPYQLAEALQVRLEVFGPNGQRVRTLVTALQPAGYHEVRWDGRDDRGVQVGSGIYVYRLQLGTRSMSRRLVLLR